MGTLMTGADCRKAAVTCFVTGPSAAAEGVGAEWRSTGGGLSDSSFMPAICIAYRGLLINIFAPIDKGAAAERVSWASCPEQAAMSSTTHQLQRTGVGQQSFSSLGK